MRLISLELCDFQAHKHILVEFGPACTVIRGPTDVGKSAILRALRWVCQNDIAGDDFIREGAKRTVVTLQVRQGKTKHTVQRIRGSGTNSYELDGKEYKSFNNGVPEDIAKLLNLNEINFQAQHDSPYWFAETAGEVSRRLNAIIDLSVIDTTLSNIAAEVRKAQERKTISEERLNQNKKEYEELEPQRDRVEEFEELRQYHEKLTGLETSVSQLCNVIERIRANRDGLRARTERATEGDAALSLARAVVQAERRTESLSGIIKAVQNHRAKAEPPPDFAAVEQARDTWLEHHNKAWDLQTLVTSIESKLSTWKIETGVYYRAQKQFESGTKGQRCPICQKPLP